MKRSLRVIGWIAAGLLAAALVGCNSSGGKNKPDLKVVDSDSTDPAVQAAVALYIDNCMVCHGLQLEGRMPGNANLQHVGSRLSEEEIINMILYGGNGMIAFKDRLKEDEIATLAKWLAAKK